MNKVFTMFFWENDPSINTPLSAENLNQVNSALNEVDSRVVAMDTTKANKSDLLTAISDVSLDESTGIITFTKKNGSTTQIDTKLEKLAVNFGYDSENQQLVIILEDGTIQYVDMKALITELEFLNSDSVLFSVSADGKVTASIAKGSITADMLEPNYLANVQLYASQALSSSQNASVSATESKSYAVGGTGTREGEDTDNAKYYMEQTKAIAGADLSGIIDGTIQVGNSKLIDGYTAKEVGESGARNIIQYPYKNTTKTLNGITFSDNGDGTVTATGTATATSTFIIRAATENWTVQPGKYFLKGCPSGGGFSTYRLQIARYVDGTLTSYANEYGSGAVVNINDKLPILIQIVIASGTTINDTFKPMLEKGVVGHEFIPFHFGGAYDSKTLQGYEPSAFALLETLSAYLPLVGGNVDALTVGNNEVLHTGNKPWGSYVGNGDPAEKLIETGGLYHVCMLWGNATFSIVTANGAFSINPAAKTFDMFTRSIVDFNAGKLTIATDSEYFNLAGKTYSYQVL